MKNMFLSALFMLMFAGLAVAQSPMLKNITFGDESSEVLYIGVNNMLELTDSTIIPIAQEGMTIQNDTLIIRPTSSSDYIINLQTADSIAPVVYQVKLLPEPRPFFTGQDSNMVSIAGLDTATQLLVQGPEENKDFFNDWEITSFNVEYAGQTFEQKGNKLSEELLEALKAQPNQEMTLTRIKAKEKESGKPKFVYGTHKINVGQ